MPIVKRTGSKVDWLHWTTDVPRVFGILPIPPGALAKAVGKPKARPKEFYVSPLNLRFYRTCELLGRRYGILSALYGIHFDDEELPFYDVHPSELTDARLIELGQIIGKKCRQRKIARVAFYNASPIMSKPYFCMLAASELAVYFLTMLPQPTTITEREFFS